MEEISLTFEASNKLRAELGLPPLRESTAPSKPVLVAGPTKEQAASAESDALRSRLENAKQKRALTEKMPGKSLGEMLVEEADQSASGWVEHSRVVQQQREEALALRRREKRGKAATQTTRLDARFDEEDELAAGAAELSGARVAHGVDDFKMGESVILTLEDRPVLHRSGLEYEVDEEEDTLEHSALAEAARRTKARDESVRAGKGSKVDEYGDRRGLLHKYDDPAPRKLLTLDADGSHDVEQARHAERARLNLAAAAGTAGPRTAYDLSAYRATSASVLAAALDGPGAGPSGDYQTRAEVEAEEQAVAAARARRKAGKASKQMRKKRREDDDADVEMPTVADSLFAGAAITEAADGKGDFGSAAEREARAELRTERARQQQGQAAQRFDWAVSSAADASRAALLGGGEPQGGNGAPARQMPPPPPPPPAAAAAAAAVGVGQAQVSVKARLAALASSNLRASSGAATELRSGGALLDTAEEEENAEQDSELHTALARMRRLAALTTAAGAGASSIVASARELRAAHSAAAAQGQEAAREEADALMPPSAGAAGAADEAGSGAAGGSACAGVVFSQTTEFLGTLQSRQQGWAEEEEGQGADAQGQEQQQLLPSEQLKQQRQAAAAADKRKASAARRPPHDARVKTEAGAGETAAAAAGADGSTPGHAEAEGSALEGKRAEPEEGEQSNDDDEEEEAEAEAEDRATSGFLLEQHLASSGMAAALGVARSRGLIGGSQQQQAYGRANDTKGSGMHLREVDEGLDRVQLQYLDEYGRPMTQKEAFRRQCYNFHGIGPGKRKLEKRMRKYEEEQRVAKSLASDTPLQMMGTLARVQQATHEPYLVLSGSNAVKEETIAAAGVAASKAKEEANPETVAKPGRQKQKRTH